MHFESVQTLILCRILALRELSVRFRSSMTFARHLLSSPNVLTPAGPPAEARGKC